MRIDVYRLFPEGSRAMFAFEKAVADCGLEPTLLELLRMRASQMNGCAYCIDMHTKDARARDESDQRLHALGAWRDTPFFTARERAALALSEAVTRLDGQEVPDEVLDRAAEHFGPEEVARIVFAVVAINSWNRLNLVARPPVGDYQPGKHVHA